MLQYYLDNPTLHDTHAALKQATDRSLPLLKALIDSKPEEEGAWKACRTLLEAFLTRRTYRDSDWPELEIPEDAKGWIRELDILAESQRQEKMDSDYLQAVQDTIRNLLVTPTGGSYRRNVKRKYEADRYYRGTDPSASGQRRPDRFGHGSDGSGPREDRRSRSPKRSRLRDERRDDRDKDPVRGFTIKGAARGDSETDGHKRTVDRDGSVESLLGRMDDRRGGRRRENR